VCGEFEAPAHGLLIYPVDMNTLPVYGPFVTREQSRAAGLRHYFDGVPCVNGHISVMRVKPKKCLMCERLSAQQRRPQMIKSATEWRKNNRDKYYAAYQRRKQKRNVDNVYRSQLNTASRRWRGQIAAQKTNSYISMRIRNRLNKCIRRYLVNNRENAWAAGVLGCSLKQYTDYLQNLWQPDMSWDTWSTHGWHIDHVIPCCKFNMSCAEDIKKCFVYTNTQPLWSGENRAKWID
jgi:hypothetical protein